MDKVYQVLTGRGRFLLEGRELAMEPGLILVAPSGVPHGIRNDGGDRLVVLAVLAPGPSAAWRTPRRAGVYRGDATGFLRH